MNMCLTLLGTRYPRWSHTGKQKKQHNQQHENYTSYRQWLCKLKRNCLLKYETSKQTYAREIKHEPYTKARIQ